MRRIRVLAGVLGGLAHLGRWGLYGLVIAAILISLRLGADITDDFGLDPNGDRLFGASGSGGVEAVDPPAELRPTIGPGIEFVWVPPGRFTMGSPSWEDGHESDERPHVVHITRPFYLAVHEVTVGQFRSFVEETGYCTDAERRKSRYDCFPGTWRAPGFSQEANHPVVCVSWNDAMAFCAWLSAKEARQVRLPTEAEWEYACRAGTITAYSCGDLLDVVDRANCRDCDYPNCPREVYWQDRHPFTSPVGAYPANPWGLYDMHGNASEWCADWYAVAYYRQSPTNDPEGPTTGRERVCRGGSHAASPPYARSGNRASYPDWFAGAGTGFRIAMSAEPSQ